ncbi:MAG: hypothetical protein HKN12_08165, partial [Gemmatimonadetes bacterium]|nr:hypothetical protein [Gemmatimonadota bacterium]
MGRGFCTFGTLGVLVAALTLSAGCSTSRLTVNLMVPVLSNTMDVALRSDDPQLVKEALPTSIL